MLSKVPSFWQFLRLKKPKIITQIEMSPWIQRTALILEEHIVFSCHDVILEPENRNAIRKIWEFVVHHSQKLPVAESAIMRVHFRHGIH